MTDIATIVCAVNFVVAAMNLVFAITAVQIDKKQREIFDALEKAMDAIDPPLVRR